MIELNFIIPEELIEIKRERIIRLIRDTVMLMLGVAALSAVIMLSGRNVMEQSIAEITDISSTLPVRQANLEMEVKEINQHIDNLQKIQESYQPWAATIARLSGLVTNGNTLAFLEVNTHDKTATLKGISVTRKSLLEMKSTLEASPLVAKATLPISSLLSQENISFELKLELAPLDL